jgi:hypothetical protein
MRKAATITLAFFGKAASCLPLSYHHGIGRFIFLAGFVNSWSFYEQMLNTF